jgi:hypothetical protein
LATTFIACFEAGSTTLTSFLAVGGFCWTTDGLVGFGAAVDAGVGSYLPNVGSTNYSSEREYDC